MPIVGDRLLFDHGFRRHFFGFDHFDDFRRRRDGRFDRPIIRRPFPRVDRRRVLVVVDPPDAPGSTYYYTRYPEYYSIPGYFPYARGGVRGGGGVTIESPTTEPERPETERDRGRDRGRFGSTLAPMLGADKWVPLDFAVGELRLKQGRFEEAAQAFARAIAKHPDQAVAKLGRALALLGAEDYEAAAHILRRGLRGMSDWSGLFLEPREAFGSAEAAEVVLARLRDALQEAPDDEDLRLLVGFLDFAQLRFEAASEQLKRADTEDPLVQGLLQAARRRTSRAEGSQGAAQGGEK
ncbi:MAG: tetratricopeptide repeat protein [Planctomycetota bacterium]